MESKDTKFGQFFSKTLMHKAIQIIFFMIAYIYFQSIKGSECRLYTHAYKQINKT